MARGLSLFAFSNYLPTSLRTLEMRLQKLRAGTFGALHHGTGCAADTAQSCTCGLDDLLDPALLSRRVGDPDPSTFFDCGAIALPLGEAHNDAARELAVGWANLENQLRSQLARFFAPVDDEPPKYLAGNLDLFHNTTAALQRILLQVDRDFAGGNANLLTTDMEFPGCIVAIDDVWTGGVAVADLSANIQKYASAKPTALDLVDHMHNALVRAFNIVRPRVVFLSHVTRSLGVEISPKTIEYFRRASPRVIIILDGSQAIGNIRVKDSLLKNVDFYVGSGHKWLGGWTASGFVWTHRPEQWRAEIPDEAQGTRPTRHPAATGNDRALVSLLGSLRDMARERPGQRLRRIQDHNRELARKFVEGVDSRQIRIVTPLKNRKPASGMVTIEAARDRVGDQLETALNEYAIEVTWLHKEEPMLRHQEEELLRRWEVTGGERYRIQGVWGTDLPSVDLLGPRIGSIPGNAQFRFCFHYYHEPDDVEALVNVLTAAVKTRVRKGDQPERAARLPH
jgi:selenocysteine lyase/cysteine desulfurase